MEKMKVILDLQSGSMGVKGLTQYIYIYNSSNLATALRRCYGEDVRLFNKARNLPYLSVTGLLFNFDFLTWIFLIYVPWQADVKAYVIFDFHRLKKIASSRVNDLIRNKKDVDTIERKTPITIDDIFLHRNHFIRKVRSSVHNHFL